MTSGSSRSSSSGDRDARQSAGEATALGVLLLLFSWWNPTPGTSRLLPSLVLIALAIVGMDALRRVAIRDSPEETTATASERWHERFDRVASRARREEPAPPPPAAAGGAERIGALERLARLRDSGAITPDELEREKALVIGSE